jgi:hypothetical protein
MLQSIKQLYGWPYYRVGDGLWGGLRGSPILEVPDDFFPAKSTEFVKFSSEAVANSPEHRLIPNGPVIPAPPALVL